MPISPAAILPAYNPLGMRVYKPLPIPCYNPVDDRLGGYCTLNIPTLSQAEMLLAEAEQLNPGPWSPHSRVAAAAARKIAACVPGMDSSAAYILGLLHDIGRRHGVAGMRHITDGYHFMTGLGYSSAAR